MLEEWNSFTKRQKIILSVYALLSLPLMPFMVVMIPFSWWITQPANIPPQKLTLINFLSMSVSMSLFVYMVAAILHWCPK